MGTVRWHFALEDDPTVGSIASLNYSGSKTYTHRKVDSVPFLASTTTVVWDPTNIANGDPADFDLLVLVSSVSLELEMTCNEGHADEELIHVVLAASTPFMLGADDARYTYTTDAFAGTLDVLDKIRVKEVNAVAGTLEIRMYT